MKNRKETVDFAPEKTNTWFWRRVKFRFVSLLWPNQWLIQHPHPQSQNQQFLAGSHGLFAETMCVMSTMPAKKVSRAR